jgi:hypothetical protein
MKKLFTLLVIALVGCGYNDYANNSTIAVGEIEAIEIAPDVEEIIEIGQGETVFRFEVKDDINRLSAWNVHTDETTVGAALLSVGLIAGEEQSMGFMVTTVNGITADFNANGTWWGFYVNGEFATSGVDSTHIEAGVTYAFVFTK